jgi:3-methyladenine DNA glycosylase AlkD
MTSPLPDRVLQRLDSAFEANRDPARAASMAGYMRNQFAFFGIGAPDRATLLRKAIKGLPAPTEGDLAAFAAASWMRPEREFQYAAAAYLRRHVKRCSADFMLVVEELITTRSWWDTVDELAQHVVGPLVIAHPQVVSTLDLWIQSPNIWLARTAILHQNRFGAETDPDRLFAYCRRRASDTDFFIRKAIGWALRQYAYVDPDAVLAFVSAESHTLAPLSRRESSKPFRRNRH